MKCSLCSKRAVGSIKIKNRYTETVLRFCEDCRDVTYTITEESDEIPKGRFI